MRRFLTVTLCVVLVFLCVRASAAGEHPLARTLAKLKAGEPVKIVCYGDSLTLGAVGKNGRARLPYPEALGRYLRQEYGYTRIAVVNAGWGAWGTRDALRGISEKVLAHEPDLVIVMFGANDLFKQTGLIRFERNLADLTRRVQKAGAEALLVSLVPQRKPTDKIVFYNYHVKEAAKNRHAAYLDAYEPIERLFRTGEADRNSFFSDGGHFSENTYPYLAWLVFQFMKNAS